MAGNKDALEVGRIRGPMQGACSIKPTVIAADHLAHRWVRPKFCVMATVYPAPVRPQDPANRGAAEIASGLFLFRGTSIPLKLFHCSATRSERPVKKPGVLH